MRKGKICPIMAIASGYVTSVNEFRVEIERLPKCLKENCALWVDQFLDEEGHCGLRRTQKEE